MKTNLQIKILLSVLVLFLGVGKLLMAQTNWIKHVDNPILEGLPDSWYEDIVVVKVIYEDNTFKMWFCGTEEAWSEDHQIGYAESNDGLEWEVHEDPVIPAGANGSWNKSKWPNTIMRINDTLKMWYTASADNFNLDYTMGYAWSVEEHIWNLDTVPILEPGESGSWEDFCVYNPTVHFDGSMYHMWYNGSNGGVGFNDPDQIGYATSADGIHWDKDTIHSPVLTVQNATFYSHWIQVGTVLILDGEYQMWFEGFNGMRRKFGYASSTDGINWEVQNDQQPVLEGGPEIWDNFDLMFPSVLMHDGQYKMWYTGQGYGIDWKVGYATDEITGFNNISQYQEIQYEVFPNPFQNKLTISILLSEQAPVKIELSNLQGVLVATLFDGSLKEGSHKLEFDCDMLSPGIYFCVLNTNLVYPEQTKKIIKF